MTNDPTHPPRSGAAADAASDAGENFIDDGDKGTYTVMVPLTVSNVGEPKGVYVKDLLYVWNFDKSQGVDYREYHRREAEMIKHNAEPIHVIVTCVSCGAAFCHYETALREAKQHANSTGHTLKGEAAYRVEIIPKITSPRTR